jgi:hypothetical protein
MQRVLSPIGTALGVKFGEGRLFSLMWLINMPIGVARNFAWTAASALFLKRFGSENQPYVIGELALLNPEPRTATVTAIEPTLLFRVSQAAIYQLMANHIEIVRGIMKALCRRIRQK